MSKSKPYKIETKKAQQAREPMVAYGSSVRSTEDFVQSIPADLMRCVIDVAMEDYEAGRCIPHSQMDVWVKEQMGWK